MYFLDPSAINEEHLLKTYKHSVFIQKLNMLLENALCVFRQSSSEVPNQCNKFTTKIQLIY